jgi:5-methylcytosine-specific restriction endonuclease McrA
MGIDELIEGDLFVGILLETYAPKEVSRPRVRPISELPKDILVEFPRDLRTTHPIGTRFRADVKVCQKHLSNGELKGNKYLRADTKSIRLVSDFHPYDNLYAILDPNSVSDRSYKYIRSATKNEERTRRLRELAYEGANDAPGSKVSEIITRQRKEIIKTYAHLRSKGICESCDLSAPFISRNGRPYLEVHHIRALSHSGADHPRNVAAICPNCHRRVEYGIDGAEFNKKLEQKIKSLEEQMN